MCMFYICCVCKEIKMASQECNDTKVDVMHVSTYLPLLLILLRASLYLISMQVLINVVGQMHMIVIVSALTLTSFRTMRATTCVGFYYQQPSCTVTIV